MIVALAGCASAPVEEPLLISTSIVAELPRESGALVEAARFSAGRPGEMPPGDWHPFIVSRSTPRTDYRLVASDARVALESDANNSSSGFYRRIRIEPSRYPVIEWSWRILQPLDQADPRVPALDDSPTRIVISFYGDESSLDISEKFTARMYKAMTGERLPYAILMYVWAKDAPVGTVVPSFRTAKIQTIVVENGSSGIGAWREFRRNVLEDYRRAFGSEPGDIVSVGVMTDANQTHDKARAQYGDITLRPAQ